MSGFSDTMHYCNEFRTRPPFPAASVYDRRSTAAAKPSEVGLIPLQPLPPLEAIPAGHWGTASGTSVIPASYSTPATVNPGRLCDCGKIH